MNEIYQKLVDLYAGNELPEELANEMEQAAETDPELKQDMKSLRQTVETLQNDDFNFTEESYQRVLMKLYAKGGHLQTQSPDPRHLQYQLPMSG
jgi:ppGpp synthetase/RelA/SpoT-type nucleotidyltranferase